MTERETVEITLQLACPELVEGLRPKDLEFFGTYQPVKSASGQTGELTIKQIKTEHSSL